MKRYLYLFTLLVMTSWANASFANGAFSADRWSVSGEFLYLKPMLDDTYYVIQSPITTTFPNGERKNNDPDFHSGFRVGLSYAFCDCDADFVLRYSRVVGKDNDSAAGSFLWATVGRADLTSAFENYTGTASSRIESCYDRIDAIITQRGWKCGCVDFSFLLGLEYAHLRVTEDNAYQITAGALGTVHENSKTWGIGPQLGLMAEYPLYECNNGCFAGKLSLNFESSASLLASKARNKAINVLSGATLLDFHDKDSYRMVTALHSLFALKYDMNVSCFKTSLSLGYEFSSYLRGINRVDFPDDVADGRCFNNYHNFDLQGLHAGVEVRF